MSRSQASGTKTCKLCGMEDLHWEQIGEKWKLCTSEGPHPCVSECKYCGESIVWVDTEEGGRLPVEPDSLSLEDQRDRLRGQEILYRPEDHTNHVKTCKKQVERR